MTYLDLESPRAPLGGQTWNAFAPGDAVTAAEFLEGSAALLQATVAATQPDDPRLFVEQFAATLSLDARETTLRVPLDAAAPGTRQLARQAVEIGRGLHDLIGGVLERVVADPIPLPGGPVEIRSRCDNHLWTHEVTDLLQGPAGGPVPMQLYNEYLHQVVLLRDALLPFENWREVRLPVGPLGLRATEPARDALLTELLVRSARHAAIVSFAKSVLTGAAAALGAYGFEYAGGRVLPAVVGATVDDAPTRLLRWHAASDGPRDPVDFVPAVASYYDAAKTPLAAASPDPARGRDERLATASAFLEDGPVIDERRTIAIVVQSGDREARVDLGDALRGHRYAYAQPAGGDDALAEAPAPGDEIATDGWAVLAAPGLGWEHSGTWSIDARGTDDLVQLALLGALYPENVVLTRARTPGTAITVGKTGPARVLVTR